MQTGLIFNFQTEQTGASHKHERAPDASNRQGYRRRGTWVIHKTERADWGNRRDVLTIGGDGRMWPDLQVNRRRAQFGLQQAAAACWAAGRQRRARARAAGAGGGALGLGLLFMGARAQAAARCGSGWAPHGPAAAERVGSGLWLGPIL
jgi:hypothetical protein